VKIIEKINKINKPTFSFEIIPPKRGKNVREIIDIVTALKSFDPPFIDVTSHSAEVDYVEDRKGNIKRQIKKKRPGTISICGIIQNRFGIDTVAHLLCRGFSREETEDAIIELNYLGIENVLAVRGDETEYKKPLANHRSVNEYASDLVSQIIDLREGKFLDVNLESSPINMCIGVGGYPEKHFEAPNLRTDIKFLKEKVDAGADYIVTQMFFNNDSYYSFVEQCRSVGISVPIIPGLKVLSRLPQLKFLPKHFYVNLPDELVEMINEDPKHVNEIGQNWCYRQCEDLLNNNVNLIHFYIMNSAKDITQVLNKLNI